ncbi:MAG: GIY-YIG nuclease family protein [Desulfosalsimonadaceae bacterium]|nr:GIY-YIG nuclease family protein [Desulfosalsimonadaceae bacterium]
MDDSAIKNTVWWVYLLRNERNALYTGITTHVERRLKEHREKRAKGARFTRSCREITLVYHCGVGDRSLALKVEARIKRLKKYQKEIIVSSMFNRASLYDFLSIPGP